MKPKVRAIHAGLECGLFLEKYPHLEMVSFGPTLRGVHSPDERLEIATVPKFWDLLADILKKSSKFLRGILISESYRLVDQVIHYQMNDLILIIRIVGRWFTRVILGMIFSIFFIVKGRILCIL